MAYGQPLSDKAGLSEFNGLDGVDLLARMIYAEARGESLEGKRGCAHVANNRKKLNNKEFGGGTFAGVLLKSGAFAGMTTAEARKPDVTSQAWKDSLNIASNISSVDNPIGTCLFFVTNSLYAANTVPENDQEMYTFDGNTYIIVIEKKVIGGHTFFRIGDHKES
jgi:hypothetical protein